MIYTVNFKPIFDYLVHVNSFDLGAVIEQRKYWSFLEKRDLMFLAVLHRFYVWKI